MKICEKCGIEIDGKDGDNRCPECETATLTRERNLRRAAQARARKDAMESIGMVRVRGALGGVYWE